MYQKISYIAKGNYWNKKYMRYLGNFVGGDMSFINKDGGPKELRNLVDKFEGQDAVIVIYVQGSRDDWKNREIEPGFTFLAQQLGAKIIPVALFDTEQTMVKGDSALSTLKEGVRRRVMGDCNVQKVVFGDSIDVGKGKNGRSAAVNQYQNTIGSIWLKSGQEVPPFLSIK